MPPDESDELQADVSPLTSPGDRHGQASEQRYRTLFDSIDEGLCIIEFLDGPHGPLSDYVHIEANAAYARHAGIPNVVGQKVRDMVPDEADGWVQLYRSVLISGAPIRFERELVATGRHLELAAFRIEPESSRQVAVLFQDVTPRKRAEEALRQLNETLEARVSAALAERKVFADIVNGTNAFVQVVDKDFNWIAINAAAAREFARLFQVVPKVGDNMLELLGDRLDHTLVRSLWTRALSGEEFVEAGEFALPEGDRHFYEMRFSPLKDASGRLIGAYQFAYDVTERRKDQERLRVAEEALRQSQKMQAVGQLTGGIAHDFNNMLAIILGSLRLAQRRTERGEGNAQEYIGHAMDGAQRAATLVSRLLSFSRQQPLSPQPVDANRLLSGMENVLRRTIPESISIELVRAGGLWSINVDANGLESALVNLAVNARDAMPDGGKLTFETANTYLDEAYATTHAEVQPGQYVLIALTDTGMGMPPGIMARAFEPFFTTKEVGAGTGLGLSQVYGFAKQSGGHVKIYSEVSVGTTVKLYIPRFTTKSEAVAAPANPKAPHAKGSGQLILVVEDDDDVRRLTVETLRELGYSVIAASGGAEALALIGKHPDLVLLVTDVVMPGMNGRILAERAQRERPQLKVLFTTGYTRNAIVHNGALDDGVELIVKPFTFEDLEAKVAKILSRT